MNSTPAEMKADAESKAEKMFAQLKRTDIVIDYPRILQWYSEMAIYARELERHHLATARKVEELIKGADSYFKIIDKLHYGRMPDEVAKAHETIRTALSGMKGEAT